MVSELTLVRHQTTLKSFWARCFKTTSSPVNCERWILKLPKDPPLYFGQTVTAFPENCNELVRKAVAVRVLFYGQGLVCSATNAPLEQSLEYFVPGEAPGGNVGTIQPWP